MAKANGEGVQAPTAEEGAEAAVAEVNGKTYSSLQAAINAAPRKATVKLLADTKENVTISTSDVTLDLNGYTLNGGTEKGKPALTVTARVTVMDSSETQTGTIMREDTAENSGVSSHYVIDIQGSGWLTFESGNVTNNSGNESGKGASLVRVGDDSVAKYPGLNIKGGNFTQNNFIVIKVDSGDLFLNGGTLNSTDSYAIENWHRATVKGGTVNGAVATWTYSGGHNSDLAISGGTINGDVKSVTYDGAEGKTAKVSITGGVVNGTLNTFDYSTGTTSNDPTKATIEVTSGTFSTDPSRYLIEGSAATPNGDGSFGVAKAYLAQVGENSYYTMGEAFDAQTKSGEAITLLRDYTTGSTFNSGTEARVVDLNGHTWTCTGTDANSAAFEINYSNASLTVKNGKVVSSQLIGLIPSAMGGTITYDNSTLTFEGVEASTTATSGIETNGNNTNDTVVLKDSTLNVPNGFGIYFPSSGTLTIDNSTINAKTMGAQVCSGNLNVNSGSTIAVSGDPVAKTEGDGAIQDGAAISIVNRPGYKGLGQIAITGGTFTAKGDNAAIKAYTWDSSTKQESAFDNTAKTVAVYGGTFSSSVPEALCAEGCNPVENPDGTHGVSGSVSQVGFKAFKTLQAAIDAAQDGETVTLLADATEDATVAAGKNITLDLGGKTLTNTNADKATLTIAKGATATVKNGNVIGGTSFYTIQNNGTVTLKGVTATAGNNGSSMIDNYGTLTITGGTYTGGLDTVKNEPNAKLTINGGTFTLTKGNSDGFTGVVFNYGELTISGGEFIQGDKNAPYGQAQVIHTNKSGSAVPSTVISGGTFKNLCSKTTAWTVRETNAANGATQVSGGAFNKSITEGY
ncbi:beta strand repeat-containing protein, partial [Ellagibacter isourolithinifaciens]|uniref:beta strand repeat-containing protein n=1 Tax=Ellagibacter isourolithinifaciens TaxID=2137581 RepID=UPI003A8DFCC8